MQQPKSVRITWIGCAVLVQGGLLAGAFFLGSRYGMYHFYRQAATMLEQQDSAPSMKGPTTVLSAARIQKDQSFALRGEVTDLESGTMTLRTADGTDHTIQVQDTTRVRSHTGAKVEMTVGDIVFVVGSPDSKILHARAISVLGHTMDSMTATDEDFQSQEIY